jgi:hypothetical protein
LELESRHDERKSENARGIRGEDATCGADSTPTYILGTPADKMIAGTRELFLPCLQIATAMESRKMKTFLSRFAFSGRL